MRRKNRSIKKPIVAVLLDAHLKGYPTACGYIRLILPLTQSAVLNEFDVRFVSLDALSELKPDIVIVQRLAISTQEDVSYLISFCRKSNTPMVYELDDDITSLDSEHSEYDHYKKMSVFVRALCEAADEVWVSTNELLTRLQALNPNILKIANELDDRIWKSSNTSIEDVTDAEETAPLLNILYMGSATHGGDFFSLLYPSFEKLRSEYGNRVELSLIGVLPDEDLVDGIKSIEIPYGVGSSYPAFVSWLQGLKGYNVGVAPLVSNTFNQSKSHIKWLEYSGMGLVTLASNCGEYGESIETGVTGILCENNELGIYKALCGFLENPEQLSKLQTSTQGFLENHLNNLDGHSKRLLQMQKLLKENSNSRHSEENLYSQYSDRWKAN